MAQSWSMLGRRERLLFVGVLLAAIVVPVLVAFLTTTGRTGLPAGDNAIIEMNALDVPGNLPLVGMYSRFGFHHPGPLLFYVAAVPLRLFGPTGLAIAAGVVSFLAAAGVLVVLYRRGGQLLTFCGAVMLLLLIRALGVEVVNIWNPWVPILPLALAVALTWSVWGRDWWALPWLAGVVTFIVQCHVGFAATGFFLLASSLGWALVHATGRAPTQWVPAAHRRPAQPRAALGVSAGVLALLWIPPLVDQLTHHPGNLSAIVDFARSGEKQVGAGTGLRILSQVVGIRGPLLRGDGLGASLVPLDGSSAWGLVVVLVPFVAATAVAIWRRAHDAVRLAAIVATLLPIGWLSLAHISGLPYPYLAQWLMVVAGYLWLSAIWSVVTAFWPTASSFEFVSPSQRDPERRLRALVPLAAGALLLVVLIGGAGTAAARLPGGDTFAAGNLVETFAPVAERATNGQGLVLLTSPPPDANSGAWSLETSAIESGLQAELERRGVPVATSNDRAILVGNDRIVGDRTVGRELVITADMRPTPRTGPGTTSLATVDSLTVLERRDYQTLALRRLNGPLTGADLARYQDLRARAVVFRLASADRPPS